MPFSVGSYVPKDSTVLHYPNIGPYFFRELAHSSGRGFTRRPFGYFIVKDHEGGGGEMNQWLSLINRQEGFLYKRLL